MERIGKEVKRGDLQSHTKLLKIIMTTISREIINYDFCIILHLLLYFHNICNRKSSMLNDQL